MTLEVDFCGERYVPPDDGWLSIGREADVVIDDNRYLHRHFLSIGRSDGLWWIVNVGDRLSATVADVEGRVQAWLAPGARLPVVFGHTVIRFTAGPTSYELSLHMADEVFSEPVGPGDLSGEETVGPRAFTPDQRLLVTALAEPALRATGEGVASIPTSSAAAHRLGWSLPKFNRKLDAVCQRLAKGGVRGLHGGPGELASNRRARLVEYALSARLITPEDLELLDRE